MYYLLDKNLDIVDTIETYKSVIWTTRYYESGDFELYIPASQKMLDTIKQDYYVVRDDDYTQAMIVKNIQVITNVEEGNYLIVTGKSLKSILSQRIIWAQTTVNGTVEACVRRLVNDNAISPINPERKINRLILGSEIGFSQTMTAQFTGDNLEDAIKEICKTYKLGYDILLDLDEKQFIFILYQGTDRSYNQNVNPHVIFSNEFENLLTTNYTENSENYKNVALVAGEGEGINRRTVTVGEASDLERYEIFVDARDVSSNDGEIGDTEYINSLIERANETLSEAIVTKAIDGEVEANFTYKLNEDYFLGDVVEVINEYGIEMTPRIIEVIESEDDSGRYTIPTFATDEV